MDKITYYWQNRAHYTALVLKRIVGAFWRVVNYTSARWWNVKLGKGCRFQGRTKFYRLQDSTITIGNNCIFNSKKTSNLLGLFSPCIISTAKKGAKITIGDNCGFSGTRIMAGANITLGNNVRCGANTCIASTDAHSDDYRAGKDRPVVLEDNVWLGLNVVVLKGVTIGKNSLIGANSVVTKDIPANVIAVGNPCKVIKQIEPQE